MKKKITITDYSASGFRYYTELHLFFIITAVCSLIIYCTPLVRFVMNLGTTLMLISAFNPIGLVSLVIALNNFFKYLKKRENRTPERKKIIIFHFSWFLIDTLLYFSYPGILISFTGGV